MADENTQFCSNCKRDIPEANFTTHEIHCRRNIALCDVCQEPFPHAELVQHKELDHAEEQCKCGLKIEKRFMETHQRSECSHRLVPCQFCDLELAFCQAKEHEDYCGTRTEPCPICKCNVMLREQKIHPALCGSFTPPQERHSDRAGSQSPGAWFETHSIHNLLRAQERSHNNNNTGAADRRGPPRPLEDRIHNSTRGTVRAGTRTNTQIRINEFAYLLDQEGELGNNNNSLLWSLGQVPDYDSSSLDYMLALSLQSEGDLEDPGGQEGVWTDVWDHRLGRTSAHSNLTSQLPYNTNNNCTAAPPKSNTIPGYSPSSNIMLPCEFCEELFPEEDLIIHQTGCSPASAIASFSKQAPSLHYEDTITQGAGHVIPAHTPSPPTLPLSVSPISYSSSSSPVEGDVLIPCEFCGIALEENVLFHHQDKCDLRPKTAYSKDGVSPWKPHYTAKEAHERRSPERQRRVRHQADPGDELLQQTAQGWQRGTSGLDQWKPSAYGSTKNTNAEQPVKSRNQRCGAVEANIYPAPLNDSLKPHSTATSGLPYRGRLEGRRSEKNTETPKVPKKHNVEKEEE
ncbi:TRAF-type zinc finger domain-containing protein 1 [Myxocyprinus asiaticus]|uniref:TRAF-type zinc finger domain-containing protein 1 n=1 Tax=Myxocyprinus asiaticus TaxID=70543 RepID=UPI002223D26C|nr:TRAF-type zinc finger domain-containing protein 1 [Myxocyprinus asiaticus]XP_051550985.1 TRAF-type zinc finger domain-containing protein 1 [Myxocyprinus asiaticus]XP_051550995.1 TRAF-type zinc finger domain-containing protein 1 [Myxocyprinus asiaticus]XP_051551004.1 TRAF-type zinc finger domain-containing protein 1 [Myxocyprinus asiaticus]